MSSLVWFLLFLAAAALVVGVLVARRREAPPPAPPPPPADDLSAFGLSEVRARPAAERADPDRARFEDVRAHGGPAPRPEPSAAREAPSPRPSPRRDADDGPWAGTPVRYLLRSLGAQVGGPVAVVRHDGERFRVAARTDGGPKAPIRGAALGLTGPRHLERPDLGGLAVLVGSEAQAVPLGDYVVLIGGDGAPAPGYLALLASLVGVAAPDARPPLSRIDLAEPASPPARPAPAVATDPASGAADPDAPPVPRAVLIAEEQAAATGAGRPLAFALVTLADAEDRLTRGTPEAVAEAEADLRDRLLSAPDVRRVEPFGDLLFGAFLDLDPAATATWCDRLASGEPPLFIGAVAPAVGDPAGIRAAAVEALQDAYDQRRTRVVEV